MDELTKAMHRANDELGRAPLDYERTSVRFEEVKDIAWSRSAPVWPKWMVFMALALIAIFVLLMIQGCAQVARIGERCTYITAKGLLVTKPCAKGLK